ncbi:MAG: hypothetical protein ACE5JG_04645 [Planctomycetota bacterium]
MSVVFGCAGCGRGVEGEAGGEVACPRCGTTSTLRPGPERLSSCLCCGCPELYRHRDFSQKMGLLLIAAGVALSLLLASFLPLVVAALVDLALYGLLPDVAVCYACRAHHRDLPGLKEIAPFDLERHEHHRQARARREGRVPPREDEAATESQER